MSGVLTVLGVIGTVLAFGALVWYKIKQAGAASLTQAALVEEAEQARARAQAEAEVREQAAEKARKDLEANVTEILAKPADQAEDKRRAALELLAKLRGVN